MATLENVMMVVQTVTNGLLLAVAYMYMAVSLADMRRLKFMNEQVSQMLAPVKDYRISDAKVFPTIDILHQPTLQSWVNLRGLVLDYGRSIRRRQTFFIGSTTASLTLLIFGLITIVLGIVPVAAGLFTPTIIVIVADISLVTLANLAVGLTIAHINHLSKIQISTLWTVQSLITEIINFNEFYFNNIRYHRVEPNSMAKIAAVRRGRDAAMAGDVWMIDPSTCQTNHGHLVYHPLTHEVVRAHRLTRRRQSTMGLTLCRNSLISVFIQVFRDRNDCYASLIDDMANAERLMAAIISQIEWMDDFRGSHVAGFNVTYVNIGNFIAALLSVFGAIVQNYWLT